MTIKRLLLTTNFMRYVVKKISLFVKTQQTKYTKHVIRMKVDFNVNQLTFDDDTYTKKVDP